jgi:hypothetical protein
MSLVKAIRVRVRCLANSLVVPDPDHFPEIAPFPKRESACLASV